MPRLVLFIFIFLILPACKSRDLPERESQVQDIKEFEKQNMEKNHMALAQALLDVVREAMKRRDINPVHYGVNLESVKESVRAPGKYPGRGWGPAVAEAAWQAVGFLGTASDTSDSKVLYWEHGENKNQAAFTIERGQTQIRVTLDRIYLIKDGETSDLNPSGSKNPIQAHLRILQNESVAYIQRLPLPDNIKVGDKIAVANWAPCDERLWPQAYLKPGKYVVLNVQKFEKPSEKYAHRCRKDETCYTLQVQRQAGGCEGMVIPPAMLMQANLTVESSAKSGTN